MAIEGVAAEHGDFEFTLWSRHGRRLYVRDSGAELGWWDLVTNEGHPTSVESADSLVVAVEVWANTAGGKRASALHRTGSPAMKERQGPAPLETTTGVAEASGGQQWADLALNVPAHSVLMQVHHFESQRRAIQWVPRPARRTFGKWLTSSSAERRHHRAVLAWWRGVNQHQMQLDQYLRQEAQPWVAGAIGEQAVAREIDSLIKIDPRWRVLHAVPIGDAGSDIDHVLIGPGGVFTLNAKHHPRANIWVAGSTFLVNGTRQPYVRNSRHEASRASRLLTKACGFPVGVRGVIVPVNARNFTVRDAHPEVDVINRQRLVPWMLSYGERMPMPVVDEVFAVARRAGSWR
ncbi:MAG TPA: nuclease-related domain-containing protein [Candidatus Lumbricidophila sp.]|nr:nuclease-related domain-containing protein [Candidatus Lumbricidophila sp.]